MLLAWIMSTRSIALFRLREVGWRDEAVQLRARASP